MRVDLFKHGLYLHSLLFDNNAINDENSLKYKIISNNFILNVFYVFSKRALRGNSFFLADRNHIHDHLNKFLNSVPNSVLTIYIMQLGFVIAGLAFYSFVIR